MLGCVGLAAGFWERGYVWWGISDWTLGGPVLGREG